MFAFSYYFWTDAVFNNTSLGIGFRRNGSEYCKANEQDGELPCEKPHLHFNIILFMAWVIPLEFIINNNLVVCNKGFLLFYIKSLLHCFIMLLFNMCILNVLRNIIDNFVPTNKTRFVFIEIKLNYKICQKWGKQPVSVNWFSQKRKTSKHYSKIFCEIFVWHNVKLNFVRNWGLIIKYYNLKYSGSNSELLEFSY